MKIRITLAVKEPPLRKRIGRLLRNEDAVVQILKGRAFIWDDVLRSASDLLVVSRSLIPEPHDGNVGKIKKLPNPPALVILSDRDDAKENTIYRSLGAKANLYAGAIDDVLKEALSLIVENERSARIQEVMARRAIARPRLGDFVSSSPSMIAFMKTVHRVVKSDAGLLIMGETGVGKERLARAIHAESNRSEAAFISVNCAAMPATLIESELFGHEEGAFTGATRSRRGAFEMAHRGTIFLDEIGEMPLVLQTKLLQVLQDFEIRPVGAEYGIPVDVRVMTATNRDLPSDVEEGRFRSDLYYRISVISLQVPALRERSEDISVLAKSFVKEIGLRVKREAKTLSEDAVDSLIHYAWPGNVRELINVIERAILLGEGPVITSRDLPREITEAKSQTARDGGIDGEDNPCPDDWLEKPLKDYREAVVEKAERSYLAGVLEKTQGRIAEAARRAGLASRSLHAKMKKYGLHKEHFKTAWK